MCTDEYSKACCNCYLLAFCGRVVPWLLHCTGQPLIQASLKHPLPLHLPSPHFTTHPCYVCKTKGYSPLHNFDMNSWHTRKNNLCFVVSTNPFLVQQERGNERRARGLLALNPWAVLTNKRYFECYDGVRSELVNLRNLKYIN